MKSLQMNVKDSVEFDRKFVRSGPEFRCYNCGKWFTRLLYWTDKKLYKLIDDINDFHKQPLDIQPSWAQFCEFFKNTDNTY